MRKRTLYLAIGLLVAMMLCSTTAVFANGSEEKVTNTDEGTVTLTFWDENAGPNRTPYYQQMIAKFEAENPTIKVNYVGLPWSDAKSKYDVAIQSKTTPDVGGVAQTWISDFVINDALLPLDDYFNNWANKDDMIKGYLDGNRSCAPDGKLYVLNNTANIPVLWYRKDLFEKAGIPAPKTWDEVFADIEKTSDPANRKFGFSIRGGSGGVQLLEQMMYSYSGINGEFDENGKCTINAPANVECVERLASIYNKYTPESDITNGYKEMVAAFDTGVATMIYHNLGSYGEHMKTLGAGKFAAITDLEGKSGKHIIAANGCIGYGIFKTTKHPKEAFKLVAFFNDAEQNLFWNENIGQLPTNKIALDSDFIHNTQHIQSAATATSNPNVEMFTVPIYLPGYSDLVGNELVPMFQDVLLGNKSAKEFLNYWNDAVTKLKTEYDTYFNK
ncbi:sugar ABC transporter substrate-binding protein [uncultured Sphaerochaeta sp.]|uniref:ABC transporter substrate-binding protein n=1 Tax=uncultured Sphaerochaeta sp. TaxID=886478 RepID=UPI002A0A6C69|nr:sugar ABC transporter substrate-binding protein [uncultured Sphaerochaeta sp.]